MKFEKGSIRKSLYFSIIDGLFNAMMMGVSEPYLLAYGVALGASPSQIAFLASAPALIAAVLQIRSASLTQSIGSRLKLINVVVFFHALAWVPIILIPYVLPMTSFWVPWALVVSAIVFVGFGTFSVPAWQSLMSDTIPVKKRGRYFGWRNRLQGILTVTVSVGAGLVLHAFGKDDIRGFTVIFVFAMLCRFLSWACLTRMKEPFRHTSHDIYFSFWNFLKQLRTSNFARFVFFVSLMSFSVNLSAPLLPVFLLRDLELHYASYMVLVTSASISGFLFQRVWGVYGDLVGNMRILRIVGWGVAVIPLFWMVSRWEPYLWLVQFVAGAFWGGFNLLVTNFIQEAVSPGKRIRCTAYFNVMNSFAVFLGAMGGGILIHHIPPLFGYSFLTLFLISFFARAWVMLWLSRRVNEVRTGVADV